MKQAYSIEEFAKDHSISRSQVYTEIKAGRLVPMKVGRRKLISREAAEKWRRVMAEEEPTPKTIEVGELAAAMSRQAAIEAAKKCPSSEIQELSRKILNAVDTTGLSGDN